MLLRKLILNALKDKIYVRYDPDGTIKYFSHEEFDGLLREDKDFRGNQGQLLRGHFYYCGKRRTDRLIIFDHGMVCGHIAYMPEINELCKNGYTVFAYDHTGTSESEGKNIRSVTQSLSDLDCCIQLIRSLEEYAQTSLSVVGHSWGGFSAMNSPSLYPEITHVVALAGFISLNALLNDFSTGALKIFRKPALSIEQGLNPKYSACDARNSLKAENTKFLILHSKDDYMVNYDTHFAVLQDTFKDDDRVQFIGVDKKGHNPNYTEDAIAYKLAFLKERKAFRKKKPSESEKQEFVSRYNWQRMMAQDADIWKRIFEFLES